MLTVPPIALLMALVSTGGPTRRLLPVSTIPTQPPVQPMVLSSPKESLKMQSSQSQISTFERETLKLAKLMQVTETIKRLPLLIVELTAVIIFTFLIFSVNEVSKDENS